MRPDVSCGQLYREALAAFGIDTPEHTRLFASGFVCGQAEKICLGACEAAMFRPSLEYGEIIEDAITAACKIYDLVSFTIEVGEHREYWIQRPMRYDLRELFVKSGENTSDWHQLRGLACGVPSSEIDTKFHERQGAAERAD